MRIAVYDEWYRFDTQAVELFKELDVRVGNYGEKYVRGEYYLHFFSEFEDCVKSQFDKIMYISRPKIRKLNKEEYKVELYRIRNADYVVTLAEDRSENKKHLDSYVQQWLREQLDPGFITEEEIVEIVEDMIKKSKKNIQTMIQFTSVPFVVRFIQEEQLLVINSYMLREKYIESVEETLRIQLAHELGHALDPEYHELIDRAKELTKKMMAAEEREEFDQLFEAYKQTHLRKEETAWDLGYSFCFSTMSKALLDQAKKDALLQDEQAIESRRDVFLQKWENRTKEKNHS